MRTCLFYIFLSLSLVSCVSTRHVNDFTEKSVTGLTTYEELGFSQQSVNKKNYDLDLVLNSSILSHEKYQEGLAKYPSYSTAQVADSITDMIYTACVSYLDALHNLSQKDLGTVKLDEFTATLRKGTFGGIEITEEQAKSYSNIGNQLGRALTGGYRLKKLKDYIRNGNAPLSTLLSKLDEIIGRKYLLNINNERQFLQGFYFEFTKDTLTTAFERKNVVREYYRELNRLSAIEEKLQLYSGIIAAIKGGHQAIFESLDMIPQNKLKEKLAGYGTELETLVSAFRKLQNEN